MKRWIAPSLLLVFVVCLFIGGSIYVKEVQTEQTAQPLQGELVVYSDLPNNITSVLAESYQKDRHVKVTILPLTEDQMEKRLSSKHADQSGDLVITSQDNLEAGVRLQQFTPVISESIDEISDRFKNTDNYWVGLWYDPVIFAQSNDFYKGEGKNIGTWETLAKPGDWKVIMTDFVASHSAANILYNFVEAKGVDKTMAYFVALKSHIVQHAKFLSTPVRLASLGETDIGIGNYSDGNQYVLHNYPVKIIFPKDGTPYTLMGVGVLKSTKNKDLSRDFVKWLLLKETAQTLIDNNFKFGFTNPEIPAPVDSLGKTPILLDVKGNYTAEGKKELLDLWISQVRFRKD